RHRLGAADVLDRDAVVRNVRRRGGQAVAIPEETDILTTVRACLRPNDVVICMSSGDFGGLPRHLLELLRDER
ncbi:MAG: UDP-N-acetylmuramate dehydrogenase, partial [Holophagae bacterium]|nr:UDP-N-acetylmuramate dehydrogenase [Holophagae bacterium]